MVATKRILTLAMISILLSACKPGPVYLGGPPPTPVADNQGHVQYISYHAKRKNIVMVPPSKGSDLISNKISAAFAKDPALSPYNIGVTTHRGEVTLTGNVPNDKVRSYAIKVARYTKGVLMVHDHLTLLAAN